MPVRLSIISPCYGAPTLLKELVSCINDTVRQITDDFEIILVEDYSPDNSREIIREICSKDKRVKSIFLSRNFGQQAALNAGFDAAQGEWTVTLDCDLQNPPQYIKELYDKALEGYDIVFASRRNRPDKAFIAKGSRLFNSMMGFLTGTPQDESIAEFAIYSRKAVEALRSMGDYVRYYPLMDKWIGFKTAKIAVPHQKRNDGKHSSFKPSKRIMLALKTAAAFSTKPLHLIVYVGLALTAIAIIAAIYLAVDFLITGIDVSGWLTLFVSIWFIAGVIVVILGIIAIYIGMIFNEVKSRPTYITDEKLNF